MNTAVKKHPVIVMQPVESSQIAAIGHDPATNTLAIEFKSWNKDKPENIYHYDNFTSADFEEFKNAKSFGSHFKTHIKAYSDKFPYTKIS